MLKECLWIPELETERLFLRKLTLADADDLREWLGLDIVYKYWGRPAGKGEKNPELLFIDPRPNVKRKTWKFAPSFCAKRLSPHCADVFAQCRDSIWSYLVEMPVHALLKIISDISINVVSAVSVAHFSISDTAFMSKSTFL